jgi:gluconokinase
MIEGDDRHLPGSQAKMCRGIPLDDEDRARWLDRLGELVQSWAGHVVATCPALKRSYRNRLRAVAPTRRIVYLEITTDEARARVATRAGHGLPSSLVSNRFGTLEETMTTLHEGWPRTRDDASMVRLGSNALFSILPLQFTYPRG